MTNVLGEGVYKVVDRLGDHCVVKAPKETLSDSQVQCHQRMYKCPVQ